MITINLKMASTGIPQKCEPLSTRITWTEFPVDLRIFVGVLGERDAVYEICKHLV
jgi:hypothetical protein